LINKLALNLIADVMGWDDADGTATREYEWLRLMSSVKYDGYSDFRAGSRFLEALAAWLKQFEPADRPVAYEFVRRRLVYISPAEMQCLIEGFVPEVVTPSLRRKAAEELGIKPHQVWGSQEGTAAFSGLLRRTLIVGLSDGSRIDVLRRANSKRLTTEQIVPMMDVGREKWEDLAKNLADDAGADAKFKRIYLIDDFTASGTTFVRFVDGDWKGKLTKFNKLVCNARKELGNAFPIVENYDLHIHHYVSSMQAREKLLQKTDEAETAWAEKTYGSVTVTESLLLPDTVPLKAVRDAAMIDLCNRYYDHSLFVRLQKHCEQAGQTDMRLGYADCALPVILDHNAPNNAISLLWAETAGADGPAMRPLFRRRDRHG